MAEYYNKVPEPGSISLQGKVHGVALKAGGKGSHIRVTIDFPDEPGNAKMLDDLRGTGKDVNINGPILVAKDTEHPDQTHFGDDDPPPE